MGLLKNKQIIGTQLSDESVAARTACDCMPGFTNDLSRGIKNCSLIDCVHGSPISSSLETVRSQMNISSGAMSSPLIVSNFGDANSPVCTCASGWGGLDCRQCTTDSVCKSLLNNNNSICDMTYIPHKEKLYSCEVTSQRMIPLMGNYITIDCMGMENSQTEGGTCYFRAFDKTDSALAETFYCTFHDCVLSLGEDGIEIEYKCKSTSGCNCSMISPKCENPFVLFILSHMTGYADVTCNNETKSCVVKHENFPGIIETLCDHASECLGEYIPPPKPPVPDYTRQIVSATIGSVILLLLIIVIIFSIIYSKYQTRVITREYKEMMDTGNNQFGAKLEIRNLTYMIRTSSKKLKTLQSVSGVNEEDIAKEESEEEREQVLHIKSRNRITLLHGITHIFKPGSVTAIMGPSGAGKSSLLDILAGRCKTGDVRGELLVNDKPIDYAQYKRMAGYVSQQDDHLMGTMTVFESIMFSAELRLPDAIPYAEKKRRVEQVMEELGISHIRDRKIGDSMTRGISGGEKRRVSIACELVISPQILYCDEPTSGLDSYHAVSVMKIICELATKHNRTVIFSIHQPRSNIFEQFDNLLLLKDGRIFYSGSAMGSLTYLSKLGYDCPAHYNPADFLLDTMTLLSEHSKSSNKHDEILHQNAVNNHEKDFTQTTHTEQPIYKSFNSNEEGEGESVHLLTADDSKPIYDKKIEEYATSFYTQLFVLSKRCFQNFYRNLYLMPAHYASAIIMGLLLGIVYFQQGNNIQACQNRMGSIFFMCALLNFAAMSSLELFITERTIYVRERANGYYYSFAYFLSKILFDLIPLRVIPPILMGSIAYWMIGLREITSHFFWFLLILIIFNVASGALCYCIGAIAPNVGSGNLSSILLILGNMLMAGFILNIESLPVYLSWIKYFSYFGYAYEALLINELHGFPIVIDPKGFPSFPGDGDFFLKELGFQFENFYADVILTSLFAVFFIVLAGFLLRFFVKEKR
ncbi:hypothetical protein C9374_011775 [Naegleria lovaniensis]|uniref:ABC transporter domain-containing protein n=1 Tax=Naegleria lovaniensis TaxID=51637 RepID=A0AA88G9D7_NAELO|nr:uncharacterized protein C9374_011775 [Naegleria lovaniensis]KAG2373890.1 hypothetical protein C9374_011775 [Naegleria lovaniensis]